jgi:hypothetical protein
LNAFKVIKCIIILVLSVHSNDLLHAQFYVKEGTVMQLHQDIVTQEKTNVINQTLSGQGNLVFNSGQQQTLASDNMEVTLIGLSVIEGHLEVQSSFRIRNNLNLSSSYLQVSLPLVINGKLIQDKSSEIQGLENIIVPDELKPIPAPLTTVQLLNIQWIPQTAPEAHAQNNANEVKPKNYNIFYVEHLKSSIDLSIMAPPPKAA